MRFVNSKATLGAPAVYQVLEEADIPTNFLKNGDAWLVTGNTTLTGTASILGTGANGVYFGESSSKLSFTEFNIGAGGFQINTSTLGISATGSINIGTSGGTFNIGAGNLNFFNSGLTVSLQDFSSSRGMVWDTSTGQFSALAENGLVNIWSSQSTGSAFRSALDGSSAPNVGFEWLSKGTGVYAFLGNATQAARITLSEATGNGTNFVTIKGAENQASSITLTAGTSSGTIATVEATQPLDTNLTTLAGLPTGAGVAGYKVQLNSGGTDYELAAQSADPATTVGDTLYLGSTAPNAYARLGIGTNGQVLTSNGTVPTWASPSVGRALTGTSTMTGNVTDAFGTNTWTGTSTVVGNAYTFNSAFTSNGANQGSWRINGTITGSATVNRAHWSMQMGQALTTGATGQTFSVHQFIPTLSAGHANAMLIGFDWLGTISGAQAGSALNIPILIRDTNGQIRTAGTAYIGDIATAPTARIHIAAGTTTAGSGPIKLTEGSNPTSAEDGLINYVSNNLTFTETTTVHVIPKTLVGSATLNFDLTAVNYQDLTITVTGAADGDVVSIGVPNGAVVADVTYFGWVSGANTVTVRCSRVGGGGAADPASGTFRASVIKA